MYLERRAVSRVSHTRLASPYCVRCLLSQNPVLGTGLGAGCSCLLLIHRLVVIIEHAVLYCLQRDFDAVGLLLSVHVVVIVHVLVLRAPSERFAVSDVT